MSGPALAGLIAFAGIPYGYAVVLSFHNVRLGSPLEPTCFGLEQYRRLFTDPDLAGPFLRALLDNLTFAVVVAPFQTALALGLAILLNRKLKAIGLFRSLFFMPARKSRDDQLATTWDHKQEVNCVFAMSDVCQGIPGADGQDVLRRRACRSGSLTLPLALAGALSPSRRPGGRCIGQSPWLREPVLPHSADRGRHQGSPGGPWDGQVGHAGADRAARLASGADHDDAAFFP
ncbi:MULTISPECIES: carbohydrate ABC transporter permease [unclassified Streptomyces]|uniref:carbohydrate ABC transporter permease n=1 Tax=unclassified Streptomyces TaxID=2593676 RepID=UPI002E1CA9F0